MRKGMSKMNENKSRREQLRVAKSFCLNPECGRYFCKCGKPKMSPTTVDVSVIKEYGLTQKLSNSIRVY